MNKLVARVCEACGHPSTASYRILRLERSAYLCVKCAPRVARGDVEIAPKTRSGERSRVVRKDIAALERVRAARDAARFRELSRGALYVVPDGDDGEPFQLYAIRRERRVRDGRDVTVRVVIFQSKRSPNAFLVYDDLHRPYDEWFR